MRHNGLFYLLLVILTIFSVSCQKTIINNEIEQPQGIDGLSCTVGDAFESTQFGGKFPYSYSYSGTDNINTFQGSIIFIDKNDESKNYTFPISLQENKIYVDNLIPGTDYEYFVAIHNTKASVLSEKKHFTTLPRVKAPEGAVDLGLSVFWSINNLGGKSSEDSGDLYSWGDPKPFSSFAVSFSYKSDLWFGYKWSKDSGHSKGFSKYCSNGNEPDGLILLEAGDDPATSLLGGQWRSPSNEEVEELNEAIRLRKIDANYNAQEMVLVLTSTMNAFKGNSIQIREFQSKVLLKNNESYYSDVCSFWTRNLCEDNNEYAYAYQIDHFESSLDSKKVLRYEFLPIRPVYPVK